LTPAQVLGPGGVADAFDRLKEQGLIRAAGITAAGETKACLEVIASGRFDTAQVYYNAVNPSAAWRHLPAGWSGGQDFCGILAACFHQTMGVLNIRVLAGGVLASHHPPGRLFVMTSDTDLDNEVRCDAAVRRAISTAQDTPAQAALRFVLGNRDFASRVIGISTIAQLDPAIEAVERGPLPSSAVATLWANGFRD
jgi:L-galactose dehydrogenase/L-glyceraldehyde 3-phosphate reductase